MGPIAVIKYFMAIQKVYTYGIYISKAEFLSAFEIYIPYVYTFCIAMKYLMTAMGPIHCVIFYLFI